MTGQPAISVVVPCYNEQGNLLPLIQATQPVLDSTGLAYEIIITDDCSNDGSWPLLQKMAAENPRLRVQRLAQNYGQSAALWAGIQIARGDCIATLDADLQNDPRELPRFLTLLKQCDCVCGSRVKSRQQGDSLIRRLSSKLANGVRNRITRETVSDSACCFRVFKRECVANLKFFKGMHRFLPTLFKLEGFTVLELPVNHQARLTGTSHYGVWNRVFVTIYDLFAVRWMQKRMFRYQIQEQVELVPSPAKKLESLKHLKLPRHGLLRHPLQMDDEATVFEDEDDDEHEPSMAIFHTASEARALKANQTIEIFK